VFHPRGPSFLELCRQALSSTERGYDLLASKFDYTPFRTPDAVLEPTVEKLVRDGEITAALDLCCGTGAAMIHLRPHVQERLTGIDFSAGMLEVARQRVGEASGEVTPEFVRGDVLAMPFEADFDLAICVGALGHILPEDEDRFVDGVKRALKPGGRFVLITGERPPKRSVGYLVAKLFNAVMRIRNFFWRPRFIMYYLTFLLPEAADLLRRHGFEVEIREGIYPEPYHGMKLLIATRR